MAASNTATVGPADSLSVDQARNAAAAAVAAASVEAENNEALVNANARRRALAERAAARAPSALAAATTDAERDLIHSIFDAIPGVLELSGAHGHADAFDPETVDAKWDAWEAARKHVEELAVDLIELPVATAADALRRIDLHREVFTLTEMLLDKGDTLDGFFHEDAEVVGTAAINALRQLTAPPPGAALWAERKAEYEAAKLAWTENCEASAALTDQIDATAPEWLKRPNWRTGDMEAVCDSIGRFDVITRGVMGGRPEHPELAERRTDFEAWLASISHLVDARDQLDGDEGDAAYDRLCDTERALIETPAPDLAAVALKLALLVQEQDDDKLGLSDPIYLAAVRDVGIVDQAWPAHIHADVCRLAALPVAAHEPFRPRHWVNRFREAGGTVTLDGEEVLISTPAEALEATVGLRAELNAGRAHDVLKRYLMLVAG